MQRRNFISNLAVILPAGAVAPNLLFENRKQYKNLTKTKVLVLGAGHAGLFVAGKLKKQKLDITVVEPSGGTSQAAVYNHAEKPGVIRQADRHQKAEVSFLTENHYGDIAGEVKTGFIPEEIKRTEEGFIVSDGEKAFLAEKLVIALPVSMDTDKAVMQIDTRSRRTVDLSCRKNGQLKALVIRTVTASKIDQDILVSFAASKTQSILALV